MVRSFSSEPVGADVVDRLLQAALRSPTAGNTGGTAWVVLEGPTQTAVYFDATTDEDWRRSYSNSGRGAAAGPGGAAGLRLARGLRRPLRRAGQERFGVGGRRRGLAHAVLVRGRRLRRHGRPARGGRRRTRARASSAPSGVRRSWRAGSTSPAGGACSAPSCSGIPTGRTTGRRRSTVPGHPAPSASTAGGGETGAYPAGQRRQPTRLDSGCSGPSCQRAMAHSRSESRLR